MTLNILDFLFPERVDHVLSLGFTLGTIPFPFKRFSRTSFALSRTPNDLDIRDFHPYSLVQVPTWG